jgi:hypothetical protein
VLKGQTYKLRKFRNKTDKLTVTEVHIFPFEPSSRHQLPAVDKGKIIQRGFLLCDGKRRINLILRLANKRGAILQCETAVYSVLQS